MNVKQKMYGFCKEYHIETKDKDPSLLWDEIHKAEKEKRALLKNTPILKSIGAKALNYKVRYKEEEYNFVEGTYLVNKTVIAGRYSHTPIRVEDRLIRDYGGEKGKWSKMKGFGWLDIKGSNEYVEVHWYEEPTVGKVEFKVKERE